jgi:competence protein ComEA
MGSSMGTKQGAWSVAKSVAIVLLVTGGSMLTGTTVSAKQTAQVQAATPAPAADAYPEFPAGPGRDTTLRICSNCHTPKNILGTGGQNRQGWEDTITKMVGFGAQGSDEEFTAIEEYLVKNFPVPNAPASKINAAPLTSGISLTTREVKELSASEMSTN